MSLFATDNRACIIAADHGGIFGVIPGLEDPGKVIDDIVSAGADGMLVSYGLLKRYGSHLVGRIPTILRLDGGPTTFRQDWLTYTEWSLLHTVQDAVMLGADAVAVMAFIGSSVEVETLRIVSQVASECMRAKMPLVVEALPCPGERIPDAKAADAIASASRIAFEHGADLIKTYYTGTPESFRGVVETCPVPILIAGGPKMKTTEDAFQVVHDAMQAGAVGTVFGRNVWESGRSRPMIAALRQIIHGNCSVSEATDLYEHELARANCGSPVSVPA